MNGFVVLDNKIVIQADYSNIKTDKTLFSTSEKIEEDIVAQH